MAFEKIAERGHGVPYGAGFYHIISDGSGGRSVPAAQIFFRSAKTIKV